MKQAVEVLILYFYCNCVCKSWPLRKYLVEKSILIFKLSLFLKNQFYSKDFLSNSKKEQIPQPSVSNPVLGLLPLSRVWVLRLRVQVHQNWESKVKTNENVLRVWNLGHTLVRDHKLPKNVLYSCCRFNWQAKHITKSCVIKNPIHVFLNKLNVYKNGQPVSW